MIWDAFGQVRAIESFEHVPGLRFFSRGRFSLRIRLIQRRIAMMPLAKAARLIWIGPVWAALVSILFAAPVLAEYPALSEALDDSLEKTAAAAAGKRTLVFVFDATRDPQPWRLRGAVETEVLAGLKQRQVDAIEIEREPAFAWLNSKERAPVAADLARWRKGNEFDALVLGTLLQKRDGMELKLAVHTRSPAQTKTIPPVRLDKKQITVAANTPPLNLAVVDFVSRRFGQKIGDGECCSAASEALKAVDARQIGLYHSGRQLGDHEAWLPGDIVQLEAASFVDKNGRNYFVTPHHTAIIEEIISPQEVRVLEQNTGGEAGKKISRSTWNFDDVKSGAIVVFRPTDGSSPLPMTLLPRRRTSARVVKNAAGQVDLLKTIDPHLDLVHGIWHTWYGWLRSHNEAFNRLQIPVDVPKSYVINATVKRIAGKSGLGFGLVVAGRQGMLVLDSYPGDSYGWHLLDGKQVHEQADLPHKVLLPLDVTVKLEVRVTPPTVELLVDGNSTFQWEGDAMRLSLQPEWEVPRKDWLFLTSHYSDFEITALTLSVP